MGGGSEPTQQPYDELGGQFASFSGGTPGFDYGALGAGFGQGLNTFGKSISAGSQVPNFMTGSPSFEQFQIPSQQQSSLIQTTGDVDQSQLLQLIQRILGSGALG